MKKQFLGVSEGVVVFKGNKPEQRLRLVEHKNSAGRTIIFSAEILKEGYRPVAIAWGKRPEVALEDACVWLGLKKEEGYRWEAYLREIIS